MSQKQCKVCNEAQSKYKCPNCLLPYCSLTCFKRHKEIPCVKPAREEEKPSKEEKPAAVQEVPVDNPVTIELPSELLQTVQLESVAASSEIRDALKDERIRKLIMNIDSSSNPENELDKAMESELFRSLTDKIFSSMDS